jgi:ribosomal protein S28E/S33
VILDLPKKIESVEETLLKQSDVCHIICDGEFADVKEGIGLAGSLGKTEEVRLLLREGKNKVRPLENECKGLMAFTLPFNKQEFKKTTGIYQFTSVKRSGWTGSSGALAWPDRYLDALSKNGSERGHRRRTSMGSIVASFGPRIFR